MMKKSSKVKVSSRDIQISQTRWIWKLKTLTKYPWWFACRVFVNCHGKVQHPYAKALLCQPDRQHQPGSTYGDSSRSSSFGRCQDGSNSVRVPYPRPQAVWWDMEDGEEEERRGRGRWGAPAVPSSLNVIYRSNLLSVKAGPTVPYLCQDHLQQ